MIDARIADDVSLTGFIGERMVMQAASGAGKSYGIRKILEASHGQLQHIVLDVEDEFFTLREAFDYALIGGDGADVPLPTADPAGLATQLLELQASAIIQLNDLEWADQPSEREGTVHPRAEVSGNTRPEARLQRDLRDPADQRSGQEHRGAVPEQGNRSRGSGSGQEHGCRPFGLHQAIERREGADVSGRWPDVVRREVAVDAAGAIPVPALPDHPHRTWAKRGDPKAPGTGNHREDAGCPC